jgi:hypothetical protein
MGTDGRPDQRRVIDFGAMATGHLPLDIGTFVMDLSPPDECPLNWPVEFSPV